MGVLFQTEGPTTEKALFRHVLTIDGQLLTLSCEFE